MSNNKINLKDPDGFNYKYPDRSCKRCLDYPCIEGMDNLKGDFAAYGCKKFRDENTFEIWSPKK